MTALDSNVEPHARPAITLPERETGSGATVTVSAHAQGNVVSIVWKRHGGGLVDARQQVTLLRSELAAIAGRMA